MVESDQWRLTFRVTAADSTETIRDALGDGTHEQIVIDAARLLVRANAKRELLEPAQEHTAPPA